MLELLKVYLWRLVNFPRIRSKYSKSKLQRAKLNILTSEETLKIIINHRLSVSRFGDGEFQMISHYINGGVKDNFYVDTFQSYDAFLGKRLHDIFYNSLPNHLVCVPYAFKNSSVSRFGAQLFWEREWNERKSLFKPNIANQFGDTNFTRFYMDRIDINDYSSYIFNLKRLWDSKDILFVEGTMSRLGVGNDLFDNVNTISRLLCPSIDAFRSYDLILSKAKKYGDNKLILIALGHTATVLAHDLCQLGFWAIDIGHVDIEYEWFNMKAKVKLPVQNKYVNEVAEGRINVENMDLTYNNQIVDLIK